MGSGVCCTRGPGHKARDDTRWLGGLPLASRVGLRELEARKTQRLRVESQSAGAARSGAECSDEGVSEVRLRGAV